MPFGKTHAPGKFGRNARSSRRQRESSRCARCHSRWQRAGAARSKRPQPPIFAPASPETPARRCRIMRPPNQAKPAESHNTLPTLISRNSVGRVDHVPKLGAHDAGRPRLRPPCPSRPAPCPFCTEACAAKAPVHDKGRCHGRQPEHQPKGRNIKCARCADRESSLLKYRRARPPCRPPQHSDGSPSLPMISVPCYFRITAGPERDLPNCPPGGYTENGSGDTP
jgi:hypothetical protein